MSGLRTASIILIVLSVIPMLLLGLEIYGSMDPDRIMVYAIIWGAFFFSGNTCTIIRSIRELNKKQEEGNK